MCHRQIFPKEKLGVLIWEFKERSWPCNDVDVLAFSDSVKLLYSLSQLTVAAARDVQSCRYRFQRQRDLYPVF